MIISNIKVYTGAEMTAQDFAILMEKVAPTTSGVLYGCTVSIKNSSTLHITTGWCLLKGRVVRIEEGDLTATLPGSGTITRYLVLTVDLANSSAPATVTLEASVGTDTTNFNIQSGQAYLSLGKITMGTSGISSVDETPVAISGGNGEFTKYTISTSSWSSGTTTIDGTAYYTYSINVNRIMDQIPVVSCGAAGTVPTPTEKKAYANVDSTILNTSSKTLTLYARSKPTSDFVIIVKGVN